MTTPLTVRLDDDDFTLLARTASEFGMRPATLAKVLIHRSLLRAEPAPGGGRDAGREALHALARITADLPPVDALAIATAARNDLVDRRP
jgi:hypothetical protein